MSKEYTEKERREAIIDCAGSYHPAVGGKYLPWNPWLHIRKTYTEEIDRLERELAEAKASNQHAFEALQKAGGEIGTLTQQRDRLAVWAEALLDETIIPERNCSCHISPPCNDCVDHGGLREIVENLNEALAAVKGDTPS
jgi:hypothetical protein